jgi:hypothetical protein
MRGVFIGSFATNTAISEKEGENPASNVLQLKILSGMAPLNQPKPLVSFFFFSLLYQL